MIVADTNVMAYLQIVGPFTADAAMARARDREWHAPLLWRSELRNVFALYAKNGTMSIEESIAVMEDSERLMAALHHVDSASVLRLAGDSRCSAYDCEFVALARKLSARLVTADRRLAAAFPEDACLLADFAAGK
jgi:predicted nucleic acid-binding protein